MEQKLVRVPFEVELAKQITDKSVEGRIVTRDSRSVRILSFDRKDKSRPIIALINDGATETVYTFSLQGKVVINDVVNTNDLMIEIPEYMTFKDGDVLYARTGEYWFVFIYRNNNKDRTCIYAAIDERDTLWIEDNRIASNNDISELRLSTESEKQKLIYKLKASKEPKAKEYLKRFFNIEQKQEYEFKPFDKVLVKDHDEDSEWRCDLFSRKNEDGLYICVGSIYEQCIPYEGNEHLLGTTD